MDKLVTSIQGFVRDIGYIIVSSYEFFNRLIHDHVLSVFITIGKVTVTIFLQLFNWTKSIIERLL
ncbi:MAG: hypothetical protein Q8R26_00855 [bacterium]|nr:hypothetical protein [bacterium]